MRTNPHSTGGGQLRRVALERSETDWFNSSASGIGPRTRTAMFNSGLAQCVRLIVQFISVVVLSRQIAPAEFGILAMAGPIVGFVAMFQDFGITQAIIQKKHVDHAEVNALFFIVLGASVAVGALFLVGSPLVGRFYGEPRVAAVTAAFGLTAAISGASSVHYALLVRRMQFGALAVIETSAAVLGLGASVAVAMIVPSVWAFYAGSVAATAALAVGYWIASGWRPSKPAVNHKTVGSLRFGAEITGYNFANFVSRNLDNVLIGRVWGEQPLGLYDRAYKLLLLPLQQINIPVAKVMLPVLSRLGSDPARYHDAFKRTIAQILLLALPAVAFLIGTSDILIAALMGPRWAGSAPIFSALGVAGLFQVLNASSGWLLISQNRTRENMMRGLFACCVYTLAFLLGLPFGPLGVAISYAASECCLTPLMWWYATRTGPVLLSSVVETAIPFYAAAGVVLFVLRWLLDIGRTMKPLLALAASAPLALTVFALTVSIFPAGRSALLDTFKTAVQILRQMHVLARRPVNANPSSP